MFAQICVTALVQRGELNSVKTFWHRLREKEIIRHLAGAADNLIFASQKIAFCCYMTVLHTMRQWRNHTRAITGSARVEFISTWAVASPENEQNVLCLSIKPNAVFRFKTEI